MVLDSETLQIRKKESCASSTVESKQYRVWKDSLNLDIAQTEGAEKAGVTDDRKKKIQSGTMEERIGRL